MLLLAESPALHRKTKGDVTEAYVAARLLELGYTVLRPLGDNARYDLVVEQNGSFSRVQCKTARWGDAEHASLVFSACSTNWHLRDGKRGYHGDAELFGVYFPPLHAVYLVPVRECGHTEVRLRLAPARNNQTDRVKLAASYRV